MLQRSGRPWGRRYTAARVCRTAAAGPVKRWSCESPGSEPLLCARSFLPGLMQIKFGIGWTVFDLDQSADEQFRLASKLRAPGLPAPTSDFMTLQSIAPHEPLPHRKVIREWLIPLSKRITAYPIALLVLDYSLLLAALAGVVLFAPVWAKLLS